MLRNNFINSFDKFLINLPFLKWEFGSSLKKLPRIWYVPIDIYTNDIDY